LLGHVAFKRPPIFLLAHRLAKHPTAKVRADNLKGGPAGEQQAFQFPRVYSDNYLSPLSDSYLSPVKG
jgi:hypothetical protein